MPCAGSGWFSVEPAGVRTAGGDVASRPGPGCYSLGETMMLVPRDEWLKAAMTDDVVVAELLMRLKRAQEQEVAAVIPVRWGLRLPRSRQGGMAFAGNMRSVSDRKKDKEGGDCSTRCSPTTPLSWSGGGGSASPSATADGFEETSCQMNLSPSSAVRSKDPATAETKYASVKLLSRRRKTFSELKKKEDSLLKERMYLKREIATLRTTFKEQRSRNENLKKIKLDLDLNSDPVKYPGLASDETLKLACSQSRQIWAPSLNYTLTFRTHAKDNSHPQTDSCETNKTTPNHDRFIVLPDLNMMPSEEDADSEGLRWGNV